MPATLLIAHNRPKSAEQALKRISEAKELFLFKDGPQPGGEQASEEIIALFEKTKKSRQSPTHILCPKQNLGQRDGPVTAIRWMLEQAGEGIIVEEDVLLHPLAISAYEKALATCRNRPEIFALSSGTTARVPQIHPWQKSKTLLVWGWATWWDRIKDIPIPTPNKEWTQTKPEALRTLQSLVAKLYFRRELKMLEENPNYCWSYYLQLHVLTHEVYTLAPTVKVSQNIGIAPDALRTKTGADIPPNENQVRIWAKQHPTAEAYNKETEALIEKAKYGSLFNEIRAWLQIRRRLRLAR